MDGLAKHHHGGWTGCSVWEASVALATMLSAEPDRVRGKRIIELGAGCGLVGLAAGALGARAVTLTDEVLFMAEYNVDANFADEPDLHQRFNVQKLCWGDAKHLSASGPPYDVILGSDILFFDTELDHLADALIALSGPGTRILLAGPDYLPHCQDDISWRFYSRLQRGGIEVIDVIAEGPKAKKLKLILDSDRGEVNIVELAMVDHASGMRGLSGSCYA